MPLRPVLNDFIGEERAAATSAQRAQDAQRSPIARSRRRTTTGSTGKAFLAQSLREPGIEHSAQVGLVQIAPQDALGYVRTSSRQWLAQQAAPLEHAMAQWRRSILEDDEIDRIRSQPLARVAEEGEALSPAGGGVELPAKNHGEIDVRPRPAAASGPRAEQVDGGKVRVAVPRSSKGVDSIGEILGHPTLREHAAIVMPRPRGSRDERDPVDPRIPCGQRRRLGAAAEQRARAEFGVDLPPPARAEPPQEVTGDENTRGRAGSVRRRQHRRGRPEPSRRREGHGRTDACGLRPSGASTARGRSRHRYRSLPPRGRRAAGRLRQAIPRTVLLARVPACHGGQDSNRYRETARASAYFKPPTLNVRTGRLNPLRVSDPTSCASAKLSAAVATRDETRICPSAASLQSRAARLVTVPIAP